MKKQFFLFALSTIATLPAAAGSFEDTARVVSVTPITDRASHPKEECWYEQADGQPQAQAGERGVMGQIIGGIAGGLLGNQVGKGTGKTVATVAGAVGGAVVGDKVQNEGLLGGQANAQPAAGQVRRCKTVDSHQERVSGYRVTYIYQGREMQAITPRDPGKTIRVQVSAEPAYMGY